MVATIVAQPIEGAYFKFTMDNGYKVWNFQGKELGQRNLCLWLLGRSCCITREAQFHSAPRSVPAGL